MPEVLPLRASWAANPRALNTQARSAPTALPLTAPTLPGRTPRCGRIVIAFTIEEVRTKRVGASGQGRGVARGDIYVRRGTRKNNESNGILGRISGGGHHRNRPCDGPETHPSLRHAMSIGYEIYGGL